MYRLTEDSHESAEARANRWLARFAPFVYDIQVANAAECRKLLSTLRDLRTEGDTLIAALEAQPGGDGRILSTLRVAVPQIEGIEEDLRHRLGQLAPGDADGAVDLDALRQRLAERAAEEELGESVFAAGAPTLALTLSRGNWGSAMGMGIFGVAWTSFTIFHSVMMIGGMSRAIGPAALFLLLFYSIFYAVGFGMLYGAVDALSTETMDLDGNELTVRKALGGWVRIRRATLGKRSRAEIIDTSVTTLSNGMTVQSRGGRPSTVISVQDAAGKEIRFGGAMTPAMRHSVVTEINRYLKTKKV